MTLAYVVLGLVLTFWLLAIASCVRWRLARRREVRQLVRRLHRPERVQLRKVS